jgi:trk system potassium uptake protein TrkA
MPELFGTSVSKARGGLENKGMSLAAISKNGKLIILYHGEDYTIEDDDELFVIGEHDLIAGIAAKIIDKERYTNIQHVMIAGGGKVGFYLARMLERFGASVKIIESNNQRCHYLADHLQNALVLNGDATDMELLENENFLEMNAFVSATGFDEVNLLLALMAKQAGIEDVIAKISRESFGELITSMGVDMALNPVDISANHIVRNIEDSSILSSHIIQGQAELLRIVVEPGMRAEGKDIESLNLPRGLAIVALQRGAEVILPDLKTRLMERDRLVIMSLLSGSFDLEKLLKVKHGLFS